MLPGMEKKAALEEDITAQKSPALAGTSPSITYLPTSWAWEQRQLHVFLLGKALPRAGGPGRAPLYLQEPQRELNSSFPSHFKHYFS